MSFSRSLLLIFLSGCLCGEVARAQESTGSSPTPPGGSSPSPGASSAFGTPSPSGTGAAPRAPGSLNPFGDEAPPKTPDRATPPSSTGAGFTTPGTNAEGAAPGGAASSFGFGAQGGPTTRTAPASFSVPGLYGRGAQQFTAGEGRLARPRLSWSANVALGYDDNIFQTPTHPLVPPTQRVTVLKSPGSAATTMVVTVPSGDPLVPDTVKTVEVSATGPTFSTTTIPGAAPPQRTSSFVTRGGVTFESQFASRRTLFTFDLALGADYYWNRPGKKTDPNDHVSLIYLRRLSGRAQFSIAVDASYQTQPNLTQPNTPTNNTSSTGGSFLTTNSKADFSYRWSPRISSVSSVSYNTLYYSQRQALQSSDYNETIFGTEVRYLFSPQLTLLGELRYSSSLHPDSQSLDTTSIILLAGGELTLSRRFSATLRLGESLETFTQSKAKHSAPYGEGTLRYRIAPRTTLGWNAHYGFEDSQNANSEVVTLRTGLSVTQVFSARMQGSLSFNFVRSDTKTNSTTTITTPTSATNTSSDGSGANASVSDGSNSPSVQTSASSSKTQTVSVFTEQITNTFDATVAFHYTMSRHWAVNLSYSYTTQLGPENWNSYYRQRVFLGVDCQF